MAENKLNELQQEHQSKLKQLALANAGIGLESLSRYEKYLSDEANDEELQQQAEQLMDDIGGSKDGKKAKGKTFKL